MQTSVTQVVAAVILGGAASVAGGYIAGTAVGTKWIGREFAGYMGMLYGPIAGLTGVVLGSAIVVALFARAS